MSDPNVTYKAAFRDLAEKLGRTPTSKDNEWLALGNEYSRSWGPAEEQPPAGPDSSRPSRQPAPQARSLDAHEAEMVAWEQASEALSRSTINAEPTEAESSPAAVAINPGPAERGSRGPAGGVMAKCRRCGQMWERELRRGRPAVLCEECR